MKNDKADTAPVIVIASKSVPDLYTALRQAADALDKAAFELHGQESTQCEYALKVALAAIAVLAVLGALAAIAKALTL